LRIWDVTTGDCVRILRGHNGFVTALSIARNYALNPFFRPERNLAASSAEDNTIRLWDVDASVALYAISVSKPSFAITFSDLQRKLVSIQGKTATIIDAETAQLVMECHGHKADIRAINAGLEWNKLFVSGGLDNEARLWDSASGECIRVFKHPDSINRLRLEGQRMLSTTENVISVWRIDRDVPIKQWQTESRITGADWDPSRILIAEEDGVLILDFSSSNEVE